MTTEEQDILKEAVKEVVDWVPMLLKVHTHKRIVQDFLNLQEIYNKIK